LPNQKLVVQSDAVTTWLRTPRAKFLLAIDWFRQHSRIWGLISAADIDLSMHNPIYRNIIDFLTDPKTGIKNLANNFNEIIRSSTQTNSDSQNVSAGAPSLHAGPLPTPHPRPVRKIHPQIVVSPPPAPPVDSIDLSDIEPRISAERLNYIELMARTLSSLFDEMRNDCKHAGAKFVIATSLCRSQLSPYPGMVTTCSGFNYPEELVIVRRICAQNKIQLIDCEAKALQLPKETRPSLFYAVHLTPSGHKFVATQLLPYLVRDIETDNSNN
jgi:hypothetical protein